jgi:hypothetical protein
MRALYAQEVRTGAFAPDLITIFASLASKPAQPRKALPIGPCL